MERFDELLFEAIDDTIKLVFGESASELIYKLIERHLTLNREGTDEKIKVFYACLEKLLGSEGAQVIQESSLRRLCLKLRLEYEKVERYFSFLDKLYEAKFKLLFLPLEQERSVCN